MKLGDSLRRRRKGAAVPPEEGETKARPSFSLLQGRVSFVPAALLIAVIGIGLGYLVGTRVFFPAPDGQGDLVTVPDLTGLAAEAIALQLQNGDLFLGATDSLRHPEVPLGLTLGQSPLPGQLATPGDSVRIVVSAGPEERPVPNLVRMRGDRARDVLEAAGFTVHADSIESDLTAGMVVALDPEPGTAVALPAEVLVTLSLGPPLIEMPMLVGLSQDEAQMALDSVGLLVGEVVERFRFGLDQGTVIEQQPAAREMVERGSVVRLVVGRRGTEEGGSPPGSPAGQTQRPPQEDNPLEGTRREP